MNDRRRGEGTQMRVDLLPFDVTWANRVEALYQALQPEDGGAADAWCRSERDLEHGGRPLRRCAAVAASGEVVGYARAWNTFAPRKFRVDLAVHPAWQRQGIGTRLLGWTLEEVAALGGISLQARARDDEVDALAFWARRGFAETNRMVS